MSIVRLIEHEDVKEALKRQGWIQVQRILYDRDDEPDAIYWVMAAPRSAPKPTLAERLRCEVAYGSNSDLADEAADELERRDAQERAIREAVAEKWWELAITLDDDSQVHKCALCGAQSKMAGEEINHKPFCLLTSLAAILG